MKKTYNDTQCGRCGLIGHNSRGCVKQGVDRRSKDWIDIEPEEPVEGNLAGVENDVQENVVAIEVQQKNEGEKNTRREVELCWLFLRFLLLKSLIRSS